MLDRGPGALGYGPARVRPAAWHRQSVAAAPSSAARFSPARVSSAPGTRRGRQAVRRALRSKTCVSYSAPSGRVLGIESYDTGERLTLSCTLSTGTRTVVPSGNLAGR